VQSASGADLEQLATALRIARKGAIAEQMPPSAAAQSVEPTPPDEPQQTEPASNPSRRQALNW